MASNLTAQVRNIADVATAIARGDLSRKITVDVKGKILELKNTINTMVDQLTASPLKSAAWRAKPAPRASSADRPKFRCRRDMERPDRQREFDGLKSYRPGSEYRRGNDCRRQRRSPRKIAVDVRGEILQLRKQSTPWSSSCVLSLPSHPLASQVGTEGRLGVQAVVPGVAGTWKDLIDSVNAMGTNLTAQVRNIAEVTTAVARGDLSKKDRRRCQGGDP